jgi:hypothetical protein
MKNINSIQCGAQKLDTIKLFASLSSMQSRGNFETAKRINDYGLNRFLDPACISIATAPNSLQKLDHVALVDGSKTGRNPHRIFFLSGPGGEISKVCGVGTHDASVKGGSGYVKCTYASSSASTSTQNKIQSFAKQVAVPLKADLNAKTYSHPANLPVNNQQNHQAILPEQKPVSKSDIKPIDPNVFATGKSHFKSVPGIQHTVINSVPQKQPPKVSSITPSHMKIKL